MERRTLLGRMWDRQGAVGEEVCVLTFVRGESSGPGPTPPAPPPPSPEPRPTPAPDWITKVRGEVSLSGHEPKPRDEPPHPVPAPGRDVDTRTRGESAG